VKDDKNSRDHLPGFSISNSQEYFNPSSDSFADSRIPLTDVIESLPDATFVIDREGRVVAWNRAIEEMTGMAKSDILGKGDYIYAEPFYGEARPIIIDHVMDVHTGIESHYEYVEKKGNTCFAETFCPILNGGKGAHLCVRASTLYDYGGHIVGAVESIRDVTSRKKTEAALRESEKKHREIVENANSIILRMDRSGTVTYLNGFAERFFGYSGDQILGRKLVGTIIPVVDSHGRNLSEMFAEILKNPREFPSCEYENIRSNGERVWVAWTNKGLFDDNGNVREILCVGNDITELKDSKAKLSDSEDKFRLVFQHSPLGVFYFDAAGTVTECNDRIIEIWGSSREKFIGFKLLSSLKNKKMKIAVKTCLSGRHACYEGNYLSVTGGKIANLKADYGPVLSADGAVLGGIGIIEDISERKKSEDALQESEARLRLLSSQLLAAQEKERMRISREINDSIASSLSGIKFSLENALEVARKSKFDPESLRLVITQLQAVIEESRHITTDLRPAILDELGVTSTIRWFTRQFQSDHADIWIKTEITVEEEDIPDHLKTAIFRTVQEYLLDVAACGGGRMAGISLGKSHESIYLEIENRGPGFDPVISSGRNSVEPMGLLGIRERVELAGGRMVVEPKEGSGSLMRAYWPLPKEPVAGSECCVSANLVRG
jgi:PAS domain S-box-containing protein